MLDSIRRVATAAAHATAVTLLVASAASCGQPEPRVAGRLASGGGYLGDWDIYPTKCAVEKDAIILGEAGDSKRKVKVIDRSRGKASSLSKVEVRLDDVTADGPIEVVLTDATCVSGSFEAEGAAYGAGLRIDCQTGEGGHVVGTLTFANCK